MLPLLSVAAVQLSVTAVLAAEPVRPVTSLGGVVSLPGGGGSFSSGAVHGDVGPAAASAPFSKIVDSVEGRAGSIHMPRESAASARSMSTWTRPVYVAVQLVEPAPSYFSVPSGPPVLFARSVRRPFFRNA